ncbi:AraC family transcriptional regulator of adaptative response / DNA-3-methyladenine glycosylase II [Arthrobacter sp. V4I6]|uniref:AlkA N-terminal domain-containing protein n=1 Tax=unclassified Arthrobacter TaxID=235627 RepID=UPI00277DE170|nr:MULTISPECIES: AlkA N-terminal domain-containing protein [unclassified Arthrobacter]MDQ0821842.1 AraC family transcriptional regulator of adaptative response / DNA-3-methyladenine glycosylase II [Arthrobacter sp. V1I7]MDQ0856108.1 AraC family transcriptional regulator of adaptative response / DNA-3-methyladenine glycosylase II [Arthrobacter sp. V4I6]
MDFWQRYRAIDARDTRFDGQFYTAVRTTGIYCRPSCPARTPKAGNVTFYETSAAAHDAGYRACKRCLPEAVPGTPAWNLRSDIAGRAMRLINDGVINRDGVEGLAARLGYSSRQLNRILSSELGAGPLSLARASRAQTARTLLVSTSMKAADIAFAAGFSSVRQFNETIGEVFAMTPSALRATARHHRGPASTAVSSTALTLNLPYREPFDPGVFDFLAVRAIPGIEEGTPHSYARTLRLAHGDARFRVDYDAGAPGRPLVLTIGAVDLRDLAPLLSRVRRLLDLDADPVAIDAALAADPRLAASAAAAPGIRMPGAVDPQELLVRAMIGQQVTVAAARTALVQLSRAGSDSAVPADGLHRIFPTAAQIAESGFELLRGPRRRLDSVRGAAAAMASGDLDFGYGDDVPGLEAKLLPLAGVGPWTVGYVAMRVIGAPDVFLANDAAVRNGIRALEPQPAGPAPDPDFRGLSPWRSYATMHLWRAAAHAPSRAAPRPAAPAKTTTLNTKATQ